MKILNQFGMVFQEMKLIGVPKSIIEDVLVADYEC